ncbi:hypothetical protein [Desulfotomaculum sp. 1211_IL3151]|uniref:hypothetical protein n=1 Tax=Desulfotomaculum sp. 1211_IL3151 TaxID=3084055 RepID=UPI002FDB8EE7
MFFVCHNISGELVDRAGLIQSHSNFKEPIAFEDPDEAVRFIDFVLNGAYDHQEKEKEFEGKVYTCYSVQQQEQTKKSCGCSCSR